MNCFDFAGELERQTFKREQGGGPPASPNAAAAGVVWTQHRPLATSQVSEIPARCARVMNAQT